MLFFVNSFEILKTGAAGITIIGIHSHKTLTACFDVLSVFVVVTPGVDECIINVHYYYFCNF